jgi:ABC-type iron transport system FetAB permease component
LEPLLLQNPLFKIVLVLIITAVSYYCMKNRYKEQKYDKSFVNQYVFFAIINMIMFALSIFPYYYI